MRMPTLALALVLLAASCSDDGGGAAGQRKGPGAEIVGGIEVPEGAVLLGTAFPEYQVEAGDPQPWTAVLVVDGDPAAVFDDVVAGMADVGLAMDPDLSGCASPRRGSRPWDCRSHTDFPPGDGGSLRLWHSAGRDDLPWASHLLVAMSTGAHRLSEPVPAPTGDPVGPAAGLLDDPGDPPTLPRVGEPLAPDVLDPMSERIRVVEGSALLAPAVPSGAATGGYLVVLEITGDPTDVVAAYMAQGGHRDDERFEEAEVDGRSAIFASYGGTGGPSLSVVAIPDAHGDWFALLQVHND